LEAANPQAFRLLPHHDGTSQIKDRRAPEATIPHALHWI
jgi:hypothetical protein